MDYHYDIIPTGCRERSKGRRLFWSVLIIGCLLVLSLLPGCSPKVTREIRTEVQYRDRVVPVAATFNIPYFVEKNVTRDTASRLENPYAKSDAVVSGGLLFHSLESIPQTIETTVEVHVTDTVYKEAEIRTETEYVEKALTRWQKAKLWAFPWLLAAVALAFAWIFRKPILSFIKRLF